MYNIGVVRYISVNVFERTRHKKCKLKRCLCVQSVIYFTQYPMINIL